MSSRSAAVVAGVLFLVGTLAGIFSVVPAVDGPNYLRETAAHRTRVIAGAVMQCLMAGAYVGMAIVLYPVLRGHSATAAAGFLGLRIAAGVCNLLGVVVLLLLLQVSSSFVTAAARPSPRFGTVGDLLRRGRDLVNHVAMILLICAGDLMYYWVLHRAKLVAGWLTVWGFVGLALAMAASLLVLSRRLAVVSRAYLALNAVLALQQVTLAIWLIVGGFDESAGRLALM